MSVTPDIAGVPDPPQRSSRSRSWFLATAFALTAAVSFALGNAHSGSTAFNSSRPPFASSPVTSPPDAAMNDPQGPITEGPPPQAQTAQELTQQNSDDLMRVDSLARYRRLAGILFDTNVMLCQDSPALMGLSKYSSVAVCLSRIDPKTGALSTPILNASAGIGN